MAIDPYFKKYTILKKALSLGLTVSVNDFDIETINALYEIDSISKEEGNKDGGKGRDRIPTRSRKR